MQKIQGTTFIHTYDGHATTSSKDTAVDQRSTDQAAQTHMADVIISESNDEDDDQEEGKAEEVYKNARQYFGILWVYSGFGDVSMSDDDDQKQQNKRLITWIRSGNEDEKSVAENTSECDGMAAQKGRKMSTAKTINDIVWLEKLYSRLRPFQFND